MKLSELDSDTGFALLGPGFFDDSRWHLARPDPQGKAHLWLAPYEGAPRRFTARLVAVEVAQIAVPDIAVSLDEAHFLENVHFIRERIAAGDVYQVNLTQRARLPPVLGSHLLQRLLTPATPRFAAWVRWPGLDEFISASPELLVERTGTWIHAEPMKGTSAPSQRNVLLKSEKDIAELAMITDLTRNDFHQLCERHSVRVTAERRLIELPYVVQAVSDVEGVLKKETSVEDILATMHPGGSVTGTPRPAAMHLIAELEKSPRRFYCGTLGIEAGDTFRAALLIRTATRLPEAWDYGVGSAITWDSDPQAELAEIRLKLGALNGNRLPALDSNP